MRVASYELVASGSGGPTAARDSRPRDRPVCERQNMFRCTCPTTAVLNAGCALPSVDDNRSMSARSSAELVVVINAHSSGLRAKDLASWVADASIALQRSRQRMLFLDERIALAGQKTLPRSAGLVQLNEHLGIVARVWTFRDADDQPVLTIIGPVIAPRSARFLGSTWNHGLVSAEDVALLTHVPAWIMDIPLQPQSSRSRDRQSAHPTDQLAWTVLNETCPRGTCVPGGTADSFEMLLAIYRVNPGEIVDVAIPGSAAPGQHLR